MKKPLENKLIFSFEPSPFYEKQPGLEAGDQSLFRLQNKFIKMHLLVTYS